MNVLTPQEIADLWRVQFGKSWVQRKDLTPQWEDFAQVLMRKGLVDYENATDPHKWGIHEVLRVKENVDADC